ncbi:AAA family ATPase [Saccharospirillum salsuginis]|uniref:ATP-binding protein n=1 Tax=Saccharospirillum salsuginis TaxID=418750 RepID=A0A918K562_9GAMM|nr:AAA family ATPase [Saccharospirillum salsuginis]GGX50037.1 ATP-binding protein [Saccharospirillum salsuginis]
MRIAVSGTYSTGKTTTTEALALITGIPRTQARTMREILPEAVPGKNLEACSSAELIQLGIRRFKERAINEALAGPDFLSDGSSLHEWVYGQARLETGINPALGSVRQELTKLATWPRRRYFAEVLDQFGRVVKQHAQTEYDEFIHLPIEFPLLKDGHRPVSERFRYLSDRLLLRTLVELGIPHRVISGDLETRLEKILAYYPLPRRMPVRQAIRRAQARLEAQGLNTPGVLSQGRANPDSPNHPT